MMRKLILIAVLVGSVTTLFAQDEPLLEQFNRNFKKPYFSVGFLQQTVVDYQQERSMSGNNGFNVSNFRLKLYGELDGGFGYFFQTNFIQSPAILDAKIYYRYSRRLTIDAGLFKAPFSSEYLVSAADIDFVNRAQMVNAMNIGRQIGVQLRSSILEDLLALKVGAFNGNGFGENNNDNNNLLYAGRLEYQNNLKLANADVKLNAGVNGAFSKDNRLSLLGGALANFTGKRNLWGADLRLTSGKWLLAAEYLSGEYKPETGSTIKPDGYHLTAGMMVTSKSQILARWDSFDSGFQNGNTDLIIYGYNFWPTKVSELQLNYIINSDMKEFKHHQVLINFQISV